MGGTPLWEDWTSFFDSVSYTNFSNKLGFTPVDGPCVKVQWNSSRGNPETMFIPKFSFSSVPDPTMFQQTVRKSDQMFYCN